jgi:chromosome segregation ATPase
MTWPKPPDHLTISRRISDSKGYREQILSLEAENRALIQSREALAVSHDKLRRRCDTLENECALIQSQNATLEETSQRLTAALSQRTAEQDRLKGEHSTLRNENDRLKGEIESLRITVDPDLASVVILNRELQEQVRILKEELGNTSKTRNALHNEIRILQDKKGFLPAQISSRVDQLEQQITAMYQSRIWRTLVALSSPFNSLRIRRR